METQATYHVAYVALPPEALTDEQFRQQAVAAVWAAGTQYLADTIVAHRPAHTSRGLAVGPLVTYTAQVWDLSQSTSAKPLGKFLLVAEAPTAAECLVELAAKLATLEQLALEADPTRFNNQELASYAALAAAA